MHYIRPDAADFPKSWPVLPKWLIGSRLAASMIDAGLANPRTKIELEFTAIRGCGNRVEHSVVS